MTTSTQGVSGLLRAVDDLTTEKLRAEAADLQRRISALTTQLDLVQLAIAVKEAKAATSESEAAEAPPSADALAVAAAMNHATKPQLRAAILQVMHESPGRVWSPSALHGALKARGWDPSGTAARAQVSNRLGTLVEGGQLKKLGKGRYALASQTNDEPDETGLFSQAGSV